MRKVFLFWVLSLAVLVITGCSAKAANTPVKTNQVSMPPSYLFDPAVIQVKVGDTVTWTNKDNFTHDVHLMGGINWTSKPLHPGDSTSYTFTKAGNFPYICDFHSQVMKGDVIVTDK